MRLGILLFVLSAVLAGLSRVAIAQPACARGSIPVRWVDSPELNDTGFATFDSQGPIVKINRQRLSMVPDLLRQFTLFHECGHHVLQHVGAQNTTREEDEADCFAMKRLDEAGVINDTSLVDLKRQIESGASADATHRQPRDRAQRLNQCLADKTTNPPPEDPGEPSVFDPTQPIQPFTPAYRDYPFVPAIPSDTIYYYTPNDNGPSAGRLIIGLQYINLGFLEDEREWAVFGAYFGAEYAGPWIVAGGQLDGGLNLGGFEGLGLLGVSASVAFVPRIGWFSPVAGVTGSVWGIGSDTRDVGFNGGSVAAMGGFRLGNDRHSFVVTGSRPLIGDGSFSMIIGVSASP